MNFEVFSGNTGQKTSLTVNYIHRPSVIETSIHVICDFPKFLQRRCSIPGDYTMMPFEVVELAVLLDRFLGKTGRFALFI